MTTADGRTLTWKHYRSDIKYLDLNNAVGPHKNATAYAFCVLESPCVDNTYLLLNSDDGAAVWLNGEPIHHNPKAWPNQDRVKVNLKRN